MTTFSALLFGFLLGLKHATDADHLAAVATLVTRTGSTWTTAKQGVAWGLGHATTLMLVGGAVLALGSSVPAALGKALEFAVGLMLIALGADVLRRLLRERVHFHVHRHGPDLTHVHAHSHCAQEARGAAAPGTRRHAESEHAHPHGLPLRALAVGTMHGLAGSAALVLLSLDAAQSWSTGLLYIGVFGAGSVAGMAALSVVVALPLRWSAGRLGRLHAGTTALFGAASCAIGLYLVVEIGFVQGFVGA
jgi:sulfite exporter TauE/SafE